MLPQYTKQWHLTPTINYSMNLIQQIRYYQCGMICNKRTLYQRHYTTFYKKQNPYNTITELMKTWKWQMYNNANKKNNIDYLYIVINKFRTGQNLYSYITPTHFILNKTRYKVIKCIWNWICHSFQSQYIILAFMGFLLLSFWFTMLC